MSLLTKPPKAVFCPYVISLAPRNTSIFSKIIPPGRAKTFCVFFDKVKNFMVLIETKKGKRRLLNFLCIIKITILYRI